MPGTILVTVLELMELQLPSASTSSSPGEANKVLVKVSHGKREYRTTPHGTEGNKRDVVWESSDFSFPVFNLRDNLSISVLDCNENEIGRADIRSHSIIEKGMWDDMFPLKGGGSVHLKLQFVLSVAERQRIQSMRAAALKKKEEGPLKENVPEVCVEKVPNVEYETFHSAPGVISSLQKFVTESPHLPFDQSMSSTPSLSFDVKNCEDSVPGCLPKHEEPYHIVSKMDKSQLSKPEDAPKGNLRKVKEMIQAFEGTTTMEPKRAKISRAETKINMSEADSHVQHSWKIESRIRDSSMIHKKSGALHNDDVPKHCITDKHSKFRAKTGNKDTKFLTAKILRNGREEDFLQNFVEMEDGDRKSNQESCEKQRAKLTKTFSFFEASLIQNPITEQSSFTRSKSAREFKSSQVNAQVNFTGGCSPEKLLSFDASVEDRVPLCSITTHYAESTAGAKVLQNGEEIRQFTVDEAGQVAHLGLHSHQCINAQKFESVESLPLFWFSNKYQESLAMHPQMEHTIFESLTDYIICGEMRYLCLTAGNEEVKNLVEIYMTSEKCTLRKRSGRTQAAEKDFLDNKKDSCCQKKSGLDNLMGAIDLMDGFLKQTIIIAMVVACGTLFFNIGRKTR